MKTGNGLFCLPRKGYADRTYLRVRIIAGMRAGVSAVCGHTPDYGIKRRGGCKLFPAISRYIIQETHVPGLHPVYRRQIQSRQRKRICGTDSGRMIGMGATAALTESGQMAVMENTVLQKNETPRKANYGRTVGEPQLSEKAEAYYNELKKKYGNMEFILVSRDKKAQTHAQAASYGNPDRMVVLIDEDKIERMAEDEAYRKHYEGIIHSAAVQRSMSQKGLGANAGSVKSCGMKVNDGGLGSFFAVVDKSFAAQKKRIQKNAEKKAAEKKKSAKAAEKKRTEKRKEARAAEKERQEEALYEEDIVTVTASSWEDLVQKINDAVYDGMSDHVRTEEEMKVGQHFDSRF